MFLVGAIGVWVVLGELASPDPWAGVRHLLALGLAVALLGVAPGAAVLLGLAVLVTRGRVVTRADGADERFAVLARPFDQDA